MAGNKRSAEPDGPHAPRAPHAPQTDEQGASAWGGIAAVEEDAEPKQLREKLGALAVAIAVGCVGLGGIGLLVIGGNPLLSVVPVAFVAVAGLLWILPLRWATSGLLFAMLAADESYEAGEENWVSPLAIIGDLLHYRIDHTLPIPGGAFSGMELFLVGLLAIRAYRSATGSTLDDHGRVETASIIRDLLILYFAGVVYAEVLGLARGWGAVPYKLRNLLHPLLLVVVFSAAYRKLSDAKVIGTIIVVSACVKGVIAHLVQEVARAETGGMLRRATSHGDSMIFAAAATILAFRFLERPQRKNFFMSLLPLGFILLGLSENNRRIAWVIIGLSVMMAYLVRPFAGWQRQVTRFTLVLIPVGMLYVAAGWNSGSRIFSPVQTLRGVSDTSHDTSAFWREVESFNILVTTRENAFIGMGLGGEYVEWMPNDRVDYAEYREWPHNTVLGLLMLMGLFGFTAHWVLLPAVIFLSARSYRRARNEGERLLALCCVSAVVSCLMMAWGDTGAHFPQYKIFAALAVVFSAKLAVATGAWPRKGEA